VESMQNLDKNIIPIILTIKNPIHTHKIIETIVLSILRLVIKAKLKLASNIINKLKKPNDIHISTIVKRANALSHSYN
jgi:hypothetical protein